MNQLTLPQADLTAGAGSPNISSFKPQVLFKRYKQNVVVTYGWFTKRNIS